MKTTTIYVGKMIDTTGSKDKFFLSKSPIEEFPGANYRTTQLDVLVWKYSIKSIEESIGFEIPFLQEHVKIAGWLYDSEDKRDFEIEGVNYQY